MVTAKVTKITKDGNEKDWYSCLFFVFFVTFVVSKPFLSLRNGQ